MSLRLRRSAFMQDFFKTRDKEETEIDDLLGQLDRKTTQKTKKKRGSA
jgi:hypothetical protein